MPLPGTDKAPYLLTILLSVFTWTVSQLVITLSATPTIEITRVDYDRNHHSVSYTLTNISNNTNFSELDFFITWRDKKGICVEKPRVEIFPPNMEVRGTKTPQCHGENAASFSVNQFLPGSKLKLIVYTDKYVKTQLRLSSRESIRIIEKNVETVVIKNMTNMLFYLFFILIVVAALYSITMAFRRNI
ncbi:hypothetical protein [Shewanella surugensis]|uniref:Uncharacterized protein n=1 Tax=Shewanella surugensis TaxID=212020 RepID=A0ABT0LBN6_9GAMM|nr:hypothetical protein [Shewanella surugensis]MCL1125118.1 hypothetical protein [Shewanella surugensis]